MKKFICIVLASLMFLFTLSSCSGSDKCGACNGSGYYQKKTCPICHGSGHSSYL